MTSGGNNFNHFAENQLNKFSARDARDFSDVAGEREMAPKCGSLQHLAGDLVGLQEWHLADKKSCSDNCKSLLLTNPDGLIVTSE